MTALNTKIERGEPLDLTLAKMTITGDTTTFEKSYFYDLLVKLAEQERSPNETAEQAFSKVLTENKTGQLLYAALRTAPGLEKKEQPAAMPETADERATRLGPAHRELHIMATDR